MTPITASRLQSGAHIAERICCMRIDSPASKRWSACASEVRTATFCRTTMSTIVREYGVAAVGGRSLARPEARDRQLQGAALLEQEEPAVGRQELEDEVHDLVEHRGEVVGRDERLGHLDEDLEDLVLVGEVEDDALALGGRVRNGDRRAALLEAEVLVELGDRPDAGRGRVDQPVAPALRDTSGRRGSGARTSRSARCVAVLDGRRRHGLVVDADAVGGLVVVDAPRRRLPSSGRRGGATPRSRSGRCRCRWRGRSTARPSGR